MTYVASETIKVLIRLPWLQTLNMCQTWGYFCCCQLYGMRQRVFPLFNKQGVNTKWLAKGGDAQNVARKRQELKGMISGSSLLRSALLSSRRRKRATVEGRVRRELSPSQKGLIPVGVTKPALTAKACNACSGNHRSQFEQSPDTLKLNQRPSFPKTQGTQICGWGWATLFVWTALIVINKFTLIKILLAKSP